MLAPAHCFAPKLATPQRFPLPAQTILCAERSLLEVVPVRAWLAAIAGEWMALASRMTTQVVVQAAFGAEPQPWLIRLYPSQPSGGGGGGGAQVIGSSIFVSSVFGSQVMDRTVFDEEDG